MEAGLHGRRARQARDVERVSKAERARILVQRTVVLSVLDRAQDHVTREYNVPSPSTEAGLHGRRAHRARDVERVSKAERARIPVQRTVVLSVLDRAQDHVTREYNVPSTVTLVRGHHVTRQIIAAKELRLVHESVRSLEARTALEASSGHVTRESHVRIHLLVQVLNHPLTVSGVLGVPVFPLECAMQDLEMDINIARVHRLRTEATTA